MSEDERSLWLSAAWAEVADIPADVLRDACAVARRKVDHPAKLVPTIIRESDERAEKRREHLRHELALWNNRNAPRLEAQTDDGPSAAERAEVAKLMGQLTRSLKVSAMKGAA